MTQVSSTQLKSVSQIYQEMIQGNDEVYYGIVWVKNQSTGLLERYPIDAITDMMFTITSKTDNSEIFSGDIASSTIQVTDGANGEYSVVVTRTETTAAPVGTHHYEVALVTSGNLYKSVVMGDIKVIDTSAL